MSLHKKPAKTLGRGGQSSESVWRGEGFIFLEYLQEPFSKRCYKATEIEISKGKYFIEKSYNV